jgi:hypothetical protein
MVIDTPQQSYGRHPNAPLRLRAPIIIYGNTAQATMPEGKKM